MVLLVQELDLLNRQVQEGEVVPDDDRRLGSFAAHRGAEATVQLDDDQLIQHRLDGGSGRVVQLLVGQDCVRRQLGNLVPFDGLDFDRKGPFETKGLFYKTFTIPFYGKGENLRSAVP